MLKSYLINDLFYQNNLLSFNLISYKEVCLLNALMLKT